MPRIPSANADFQEIQSPSSEDVYPHPAATRKGSIPMAFQITSPFNRSRLLLPHAMVLHVNPSSLDEARSQKVERIQTRGGWVEQHWGENLVELSASASTGAFMNIYTGLTSVLRQRTIAWDRYRDLVDLYHNNGSVHDPTGAIVLQGNVLLMYDRGSYLGYFTSFEMEETDDSPFAFKLSWNFKVQTTLLSISPQVNTARPVPQFQTRNQLQGSSSSSVLASNTADARNQAFSTQNS